MQDEGRMADPLPAAFVRPPALQGVLAGIGLSVSGVLLQSVTGNDLASPNIIGVNAGAGFAVILILSYFPAAVMGLPLAAFWEPFLRPWLLWASPTGWIPLRLP